MPYQPRQCARCGSRSYYSSLCNRCSGPMRLDPRASRLEAVYNQQYGWLDGRSRIQEWADDVDPQFGLGPEYDTRPGRGCHYPDF